MRGRCRTGRRPGAGLLAIGMAAMLAGCTTLKQRCEETRWEQTGRQDGAGGQFVPGSLLARCEAEGVMPDRAAYERGRLAGLKQWCGRDWAVQGREDGGRGVAPQDIAYAQSRCASIGVAVDSPTYLVNYRHSAENYCATLDWRALGRRQFESGAPVDAQAGSPPACLSVGMPPDDYQFHAGYDAARRDRLDRQCTSRAQFEAGRQGRGYDRFCDEVPFARRAHDAGREQAQIDRDLRSLEAERSHLVSTGAPLRHIRPAPPLAEPQRNEELDRLNRRIRELTQRRDDLSRALR